MKNMVVLSIICLLSFPAYANETDFGLDETGASLEIIDNKPIDKASKSEEIKKQMSELVKELNLTPDQQDKAKYISDESRLKMEQLQENMKQILVQIRELEDNSMNNFAEILTDEQKIKFYEFKALRNDERKASDEAIEDILAPFND